MPKRSEGQSNPSRQSWCTYHHGALSRSPPGGGRREEREEGGGRKEAGGGRREEGLESPRRTDRPRLQHNCFFYYKH